MRLSITKIWSRVADIGLHPAADSFQRRSVRLVNTLGIILGIFIFSSVLINLIVKVYSFIPVLSIAFLLSLCIYPLNIKGQYEWAKITLMTVFIGLLSYMLFNNGTGAGLEFYLLSLLV